MIEVNDVTIKDCDRAAFERDGFVVLRDFYSRSEIAELKSGIHQLSQLLGPTMIPNFIPIAYAEDTFDASILAALEKNRAFAGVVYDAIKKLPIYARLATSERHEVTTRNLLGSDFVGFANRGYGMRMDVPYEDRFLTQLHQDFVSQLCSPNAVVFWSPLQHMTPDIGPLKVYPGSHRYGVFPIEKQADGSRGLVIRNERAIRKRFVATPVPVFTGDAIAAHQLLLHESSPNHSTRIRWSMISRFFDFTDREGQRIKWVGGIQDGHSFESIYPELTTVTSSEREAST